MYPVKGLGVVGSGSTVQVPVHWKGVVVAGHFSQTPSVKEGLRD